MHRYLHLPKYIQVEIYSVLFACHRISMNLDPVPNIQAIPALSLHKARAAPSKSVSTAMSASGKLFCKTCMILSVLGRQASCTIEIDGSTTFKRKTQLRNESLADYRLYLFCGLMKWIDSFCLDNFAVAYFCAVAPIGFCGSTVGNKYHKGMCFMVKSTM